MHHNLCARLKCNPVYCRFNFAKTRNVNLAFIPLQSCLRPERILFIIVIAPATPIYENVRILWTVVHISGALFDLYAGRGVWIQCDIKCHIGNWLPGARHTKNTRASRMPQLVFAHMFGGVCVCVRTCSANVTKGSVFPTKCVRTATLICCARKMTMWLVVRKQLVNKLFARKPSQ